MFNAPRRAKCLDNGIARRATPRTAADRAYFGRNRPASFKKNEVKPWHRRQWCIRELHADFVYHMEDILDLYAEPFDPHCPVVCFDELPYQLVGDWIEPLFPQPGRGYREDYTYERQGICNFFMIFHPLAGWRHVKITEQRTALDYAQCLKDIVQVHFPTARCLRLVQDNLNTHTRANLYEAFPPEEARQLIKKLEPHYTPKHARWLNMAETEFSVLSRQCPPRRFPDRAHLEHYVTTWEHDRNAKKVTVNWTFTISQARKKMKRAYPV